MTPTMLALIELIAKVGLDAAIVIITNLKNVASIDDAIAALEVAKSKTAQQYLDEAKAALAGQGVITASSTPPAK